MPTEKPQVIDFGAHCYPESVFPEVYEATAFQALIGPVHHDIERLTTWLLEGGIDGAVLSMPFYMGHDRVKRVAEANDALLEIVRSHEGLYGLCSVPDSDDGEAAAAELERCLERGYHGGALPTKAGSRELVDDELAPVLGVANRFGAPLLVHPKLHESLHPAALDDDYLLNAIFGREIALAESISKVVHDGVLQRHPDLALVYHHLGGNLAAMLGRIHLQLDPGRWPGRQDNVVSFDEFVQTIRSRIHVDTSGFFGYEWPLETALDVFSPSNIVFGTDAPYEPRSTEELKSFVDTVERVIPDEDVDGVCGKNALELLVNV